MYILTFACAYNTGLTQRYNAMNKLGKESSLKCGILDTNDMVEEIFETKEDLLKIIRANPDIEIKGLRHDGHDITGFYCFSNNHSCQVVGDYCLMYEEETNRGSFVNVKIYKKKVGLIFKWCSPHVEGCYTWDLKFLGSINQRLVIETLIRSKNRTYELPSLEIALDGEGIKLITDNDVRGY